ncbi:MAG: hypothetical protein HGA39_08045 [Coriobacteriia bacterium]|nr:hypothetical protein [Coriobacteriia bacterium]
MTQGAVVRRSKAELLALGAFAALCVLVPLVPGRVMLGPIPLDAVTLSAPLVLALSIPFLRRLGANRIPFSPLELPALVFLGITLISVVFSEGVLSSALTWTRYATYILLLVVASAVAMRPENRRLLTWTVALTSLATVAQAAYQFARPDALAKSFAFSAEVGARVTGSFGNPNSYSEYLVLAFALTLSLALAEKDWRRWSAVAILLAQSCALVLTYTRGSWLALGLGVLVAALMIDWRLAGAFVLAGGGLLSIVPGAMQRLTSIFASEGGASVRLPLWNLAVEMFRLHPWTGVGLGGYVTALMAQIKATPSMLPAGVTPMNAHNSFLTLAAETGIFGIAAFVWFVVCTVRSCFTYAKKLVRGSAAWLINAALSVGVIGYTANALTDNSFQNPRAAVFYWLLLGLMCANAAQADGGETQGATGAWPAFRAKVARVLLGRGAEGAADLEPWGERR